MNRHWPQAIAARSEQFGIAYHSPLRLTDCENRFNSSIWLNDKTTANFRISSARHLIRPEGQS